MTNASATLARIDLLSELSKTELRQIERLMTPIDIRAGREFITEGTPGREAFIILEGIASVRHNGRVIATVGPGEVLGEVAVVAGLRRSATVVAETDIVAEVLDRREFVALLDANPKLSQKILIAAIKRLHDLEPGLLG
ncbi:MAG: cyclic nucleotide-binding domain-containing protein [Acidimicrobiales bacterium]